MQRTLIIIKPDAVEKGFEDQIFDAIRESGMGLEIEYIADKATLTADKLADHYLEHEGKSFYPHLIEFMTSGPAIPAVVKGEDAVKKVRQLIGNTDPSQAGENTIRGQYSDDSKEAALAEGRVIYNVIHASGNDVEAEKELKIWFPKQFDTAPRLSGSRSFPKGSAAIRCEI